MTIALIKIRARLEGDRLELRTQLTHPMETGQRKDASGRLVPAHFIQQIIITLNGTPVIETDCGPGLSANPNLAFRLRGAKAGDLLQVTWHDNRGQSSSETQLLL
jgi:sulfur-oxidizing protein SoxZ